VTERQTPALYGHPNTSRVRRRWGGLFADHLDLPGGGPCDRHTVVVADNSGGSNEQSSGVHADAPLPIPAGQYGGELSAEVSEQGLPSVRGLQDQTPSSLCMGERWPLSSVMEARMGFPNLLPWCWNYIRYAREQGIPVGAGPWLGAGSLVLTPWGINGRWIRWSHGLPVRSGFLQPGAQSGCLTSITTSASARSEVIEYVTESYAPTRWPRSSPSTA